jgi:hypothetical protein
VTGREWSVQLYLVVKSHSLRVCSRPGRCLLDTAATRLHTNNWHKHTTVICLSVCSGKAGDRLVRGLGEMLENCLTKWLAELG